MGLTPEHKHEKLETHCSEKEDSRKRGKQPREWTRHGKAASTS